MDKPARIKARIGDINVNAELRSSEGKFSLLIPKHVNRPGAEDALRGVARANVSMTVESVPFSELAAKISWLRSGYLALFAMRGYEVALDPAMQIVRQQILDFDERKMVSFTSELPYDIPFTERRILKVLEPQWHLGWAVQFGHYLVHFPSSGDTTFYDRMAAYTDGRTNLTTCRYEGWPTTPTFGLPPIVEPTRV